MCFFGFGSKILVDFLVNNLFLVYVESMCFMCVLIVIVVMEDKIKMVIIVFLFLDEGKISLILSLG